MKNILTIDCEDWYHTYISQKYSYKLSRLNYEEHIWQNIHILLEILESNSAKATFFVLGCIAEKYPELIVEIEKAGHRIGSHGYYHNSVYWQSRNEFENEIKKVTLLLNKILSKPVESFRAPNWSINNNSLWAFEVIKKYGYRYDSSLTYFPKIPGTSYVNKIIEVPRTNIKLFKFNIPFGGGTFLRLYPYKLTRYLIRKSNKGGLPFMMYIHPWEIDSNLPSLKISVIDKIIQYSGISNNLAKIVRILGEFKFISLEDFFEKEDRGGNLLNKFYYLL